MSYEVVIRSCGLRALLRGDFSCFDQPVIRDVLILVVFLCTYSTSCLIVGVPTWSDYYTFLRASLYYCVIYNFPV